jgi:hypothetical protein
VGSSTGSSKLGALNDKNEFGEIVYELYQCNDNLRNLMRPTEANILRQQTLLLETIKTDQDSQNTL